MSLSRFFFWSSLILLFFYTFIPVIDTDFGWHYRCGNDLLHGSPCLSNTYSYFLTNYKAYYTSFIFDALTAIVYNTFGFVGLSVLHALCITIVGVFFMFASKHHKAVSYMTFLLVLYLGGSVLNLGWRPQIVTYVFVIGLYTLLPRIKEKNRKLLLFLPLLMIVWVNTHIGFFTGLLILGAASAEKLVTYIWKRDGLSQRMFFWFGGISILSIAATILNPFGFHVYIELYRHTISPLNQMIAEWLPPNSFHVTLMWVIFFTSFIIMAIRRRLRVYEILLLVFFFVTTLMARRNTPLFYTIAALQVLINTKPVHFSLSEETRMMLVPFFGAVVIALSGIFARNTIQFHGDWKTYCTRGQANYPCQILKEYPQISGNIFTSYEYGGYLIWQRPDTKVFVDGRMPAWADEQGISPYMTYLKIMQTQPGWDSFLRKEKTDFLLVPKGTFIDFELKAKPTQYAWKKVYEQGDHVIYKNTSPYAR